MVTPVMSGSSPKAHLARRGSGVQQGSSANSSANELQMFGTEDTASTSGRQAGTSGDDRLATQTNIPQSLQVRSPVIAS